MLIARGAIEVAPLAFMRGRTLNDSFVILDEAQNSTSEQMKMFLTRLGFGSKAAITGDVTQTDLPSGRRSGLADAASLLGEHRRHRVLPLHRRRRGAPPARRPHRARPTIVRDERRRADEDRRAEDEERRAEEERGESGGDDT